MATPIHDDAVELEFDAISRDEMALKHGDDGTTLMTFRADRDSRTFMVDVPQTSKLIFTNLNVKEGEFEHQAAPSDSGIERNWKIEDDCFVIWRETGGEIVLPLAPPGGTHVPFGVPEVYGVPDLLFEVAMGIKLHKHVLITGPTGTGKTTIYRWFAQTLRHNFVLMQITPDTDAAAMVGEYMPGDDLGRFPWIDGPATEAARLSQGHPTIFCIDEPNRIGNVSHYSRIYPLLSDERTLVLPEKTNGGGVSEKIVAGDLFIGAAANPTAVEEGAAGAADYIGVQELDPAFARRFSFQPPVDYPAPEIEAQILCERINFLNPAMAKMMVDAAAAVRNAHEVRFPMSFSDLMDWASALPYLGYTRAAEVAVVQKCPAIYRPSLRNYLGLQNAPS